MNSFIRLFVVILALAVLLSSAACVKKPVASDPIKPVNVSSTEPPVTKAPDPAEMSTPEETLALANYAAAMELPAIRGHYLINDDGAMYDLLTGRLSSTVSRYLSSAGKQRSISTTSISSSVMTAN